MPHSFFVFNHSSVDLWSVSCCNNQFQPGFSCQTCPHIWLIINYESTTNSRGVTARCPALLGPIQAQNHHCSTVILEVWGICVVWFSLNIVGHICSKDIVPETSWFVQMSFWKPKLWRHVPFREQKPSPFRQAIFAQPFTNCSVVNFNLQHSHWGL